MIKYILVFHLKIFQFLEVKFSTYLNRRVFVMSVKILMFHTKTNTSYIINTYTEITWHTF